MATNRTAMRIRPPGVRPIPWTTELATGSAKYMKGGSSAAGRLEQRIQSIGQGGRQLREPGIVKQPDIDQIAKVDAIFIAKCSQLDLDQRLQRENAKLLCLP